MTEELNEIQDSWSFIWLPNTTDFQANYTSINNSLEDFEAERSGSRGGAVYIQNADKVMERDDASWILTATFIIFTMQSGFGLLESGCVSMKNEANIMVKNVVDVVLGGFTYWLFGYGLSFGKSSWTNSFCGWGSFAMNADEDFMGESYTTFFFQLSFATTATTIVSGAVAERFQFSAYILFSAMNSIVYCIPAGWLWGSHGFLYKMGVIDIAGSCAVHLCGGASSLIAAIMVGPRLGRYDNGRAPLPMGNPTSAILGMFMLWWGWLGFNCGSTFGIRGHKWKYAAKTAVMTLQSSIGGGLVGMAISYIKNKRRMQISEVVNSILGALVSITGGCSLYTTYEALVVGMVGGLLTILATPALDYLHIDDPVGAIAVHGCCGLWAMIAIGLFVDSDSLLGITRGLKGVLRGGGFYLLGIQFLASVVTIIWAITLTFLILLFIDKVCVKIRMSEWEELVGADFAEHNIRRKNAGVSRAVSVLGFIHNGRDYSNASTVGDNPSHQAILGKVKKIAARRKSRITSSISRVAASTKKSNPAIFLNEKSLQNNKKEKLNPLKLVKPASATNLISILEY